MATRYECSEIMTKTSRAFKTCRYSLLVVFRIFTSSFQLVKDFKYWRNMRGYILFRALFTMYVHSQQNSNNTNTSVLWILYTFEFIPSKHSRHKNACVLCVYFIIRLGNNVIRYAVQTQLTYILHSIWKYIVIERWILEQR